MPLRQRSASYEDAAQSQRSDGVVAVTEAGPGGLPIRRTAGQPTTEPDSADAADATDGSININSLTLPGPPVMPLPRLSMTVGTSPAARPDRSPAVPQDQACCAGLDGQQKTYNTSPVRATETAQMDCELPSASATQMAQMDYGITTASATPMAQMDYELPTASAASVSNPALVPPASTPESSENQYAEVDYSEVAEPVEGVYAEVDYSEVAEPVDDAYEDIDRQTFQDGTLERKMQLGADGDLRLASSV